MRVELSAREIFFNQSVQYLKTRKKAAIKPVMFGLIKCFDWLRIFGPLRSRIVP